MYKKLLYYDQLLSLPIHLKICIIYTTSVLTLRHYNNLSYNLLAIVFQNTIYFITKIMFVLIKIIKAHNHAM